MAEYLNKSLNSGRILERLREEGLSQSDLSERLDVTKQAISQWLKGDKFPRPIKLLALAKTLKLSFDEITISVSNENAPIVAFRKKANHSISEKYFEEARELGYLLEDLVPYLPYDTFSKPSSLINPSVDYQYIQSIAKDTRKKINRDGNFKIDVEQLIEFFSDLHAVLIPSFLGDKEKHENAIHIFLPKSMTTWIYLNLDSKDHDFKFWMAHELGHAKAPELKENLGEDFADNFAGALLCDGELAADEYTKLSKMHTTGQKINRLKKVAEQLLVSPLTVYLEVNKYAEFSNKPKLNLTSNNEIFKATAVFSRDHQSLSQKLFKDSVPKAKDYISCSKEYFKSPFFDCLSRHLKSTKKGFGFVQTLLNLSIADAQQLYNELV